MGFDIPSDPTRGDKVFAPLMLLKRPPPRPGLRKAYGERSPSPKGRGVKGEYLNSIRVANTF